MKAVILAGGRGTRLAPYTSVLPKPLMPVGERAILEIVIERLAAAGIVDITLCVGYLSHLIRAVIEDGERHAVDIHYVHESQPLGTAAPLNLVTGLDATFLVMNGDILTTLVFEDLIQHHRESGALLTIATHERSIKIDYGIVEVDEDNTIKAFEEKPQIPAAVSMGIYVMEPEVLSYLPAGVYFDFPDLVRVLLEVGAKVSSFRHEGLWFDIGRDDDFREAVAAWAARSTDGVASVAEVRQLPHAARGESRARRVQGS
jgi:NDP-sugar pyrophosphorylase family protein